MDGDGMEAFPEVTLQYLELGPAIETLDEHVLGFERVDHLHHLVGIIVIAVDLTSYEDGDIPF
jgi:rhamnose utilization protein RhaD (predicted bifunctional aldolase and dehydrogenase)